jgi:hypothetical protein
LNVFQIRIRHEGTKSAKQDTKGESEWQLASRASASRV